MQYSQKIDIINDMRRKPTRSFNTIFVGDVFHFNGELWEKRSSRTAHIFGMPNRWFYFSHKDQVQK